MVATLQENATDLLDECSSSRLQYILRILNRLQEETQMLREYASQVSSEYQAQVDLGQNRNLFVVSTILIAGLGGLSVTFGKVTLTSIACALILGILVNIMLSKEKPEAPEE